MQLRAVRVVIAEGKTDAYWAWARDIVALWDAHGIVRAGGPYAFKDESGADVALWLTLHRPDEDVRSTFQGMYSGDRGAELIAQRPPLVRETTSSLHEDWDLAGGAGAPPAPKW